MDLPRQSFEQQKSLHPRDAPSTQLSDEEQTVLKECQKESTMYRAFPLSALAGVTTYFSINNIGLMKPHHTYGASPKVVLAVALGYIVGKISYFSTCQNKILNDAPNSNLAAAVRRARGIAPIPIPEEQAQTQYSMAEETPPAPPTHPMDQQEPELPLSIRTYDDRRNLNRKMYEAHQYMSPQPPVRQPNPVEQLPPPPPSVASGGSKPTNKYGDEGFE